MRPLLLLFLLFTTSLSLPAQGWQVVWDDEITVTTNPTLGRVRPRITLADGNKPVVVWGNASSGNIYAATMDADSFLSAVHINTSGPDAYVRNWTGPSITSAGDTVMVSFDQIQGTIGRVYVQRSLDAGLTWSDTVRVDVGTGDGMSRLGALSARSGTEVLCGYVLADHMDMNAEGYLARSTDGGMSWLPAVNMTTGSSGLMCDCCPPGLVTEGSRTAFLFRNNDANIRDIRAAISNDGGLSTDTVIDLDTYNWDISSCPSTGPDGLLNGDSLYHVWMYGDVSPTRVYAGTHHVSDGGGSVIALNDTAVGAQNFPRIAGAGDTLAIAWREMMDGFPEIMLRWSVNGIAGLKAPVAVNADPSGTQDVPDVAFADREIHVVWQDDENVRVAYRKGRIVPLVGMGDGMSEMQVKIYPVPAEDVMMIEGGHPGSFSMMSLTGQVVLCSSSDALLHQIDVSGLSAGMYLLKWEEGSESVVRKVVVR